MIVRMWRAYAALSKAEAYPQHLLERVRPQLETLAGFRGLYLLRRLAGTEVEYQVITLWDSMDAIRAFAGAIPARAVVEPDAEAALLRFDAEVRHYDVLAEPATQR